MTLRATGIAVAFACAFAAVLVVSASDVVPQAAVGVPGQKEPPRLVVLRDGKVIEGSFRLAQGGYEIDQKGGRMFLPESLVWFEARHRRHAYEVLKQRLPCRTADEYTQLAKWCVTNQLYSCARDELRVALEQEPQHEEARSLAKSIDAILKTGGAPDRKAEAPPAPEVSWADDAGTLGGLPKSVAADFSTRVQPLLVNRCANASCHGAAATNGFTLRVVRPGSPAFRRLSQENLAAVLGQIDASNPAQSPLLVEPSRAGHGGSRKPLFAGPSGDAQFKALAVWVSRAAKSAPAAEPEPDEAEKFTLTGATDTEIPSSEVVPAASEVEAAAADVVTTDATSELLRKTLVEERPDAFDPEEFNRKYGPQADR